MARISLLLFLLLCRFAAAFDVTHILSMFPEFSTFNNLLIQTQLAADIDRQVRVTILAVPNGAFPPIAGLPDDTLKDLLSLHVVLGYLDEPDLRHRATHSAILTTLFQASGRATGFNGFLNATDMNNGQVAFGSAALGSALSSNFVKVVLALPDDVSVMQITGVILHPGISFPGPPNSAEATSPPAVLPPAVSPWSPSSEAPSMPPAAETTMAPCPAPSVLPWFMPPPEAAPSEPPMAAPTAAPSMAPTTEPPAEPSIVLPPAASPTNDISPTSAPGASPSIAMPPAASPTNDNPPSSAPEASPSIAMPPADTMVPSPSTWLWDVLPPTSDAPMTPPAASPTSNMGPSHAPAPTTGGSPPIGLPPSYIASAPGPGRGEEGAASQGVAARANMAIAAGVALLVCML